MTTEEIVYFAHISDTHFGPTTGYSRHGHTPLPSAQRLVDLLNNLPVRPDFVVHTGDVVTNPSLEAYELAAETLAKLEMPVYYVNGNHDAAVDIKKYLSLGQREDVSDDLDVLSYVFTCKGYRFLVLDAHGPDEIDPHGRLPEAQLELVRREAQPDGPPLIVFVHYPTRPLNSPWMDRNMLILNGDALHQALLPARERLRGVFYGHVHRSMQTFCDGILYVAVGSAFSQFTAWPNDETVGYASDERPMFNFVHLLPEQTIVHQHTFARP